MTDSSEARVMHLTENATVVQDIHLNLEIASQMLIWKPRNKGAQHLSVEVQLRDC